MLHPDTELRFVSPEIGYGVFAKKRIPRGTYLWSLSHLDRYFTRAQFEAFPEPIRKIVMHHAVLTPEGDLLMSWDNAIYINHSCEPAIRTAQNFEIAVRDLEPDDEVTCDYGSLNAWPMKCLCGAASCRGSISGEDVLTLGARWDEEARRALTEAGRVAQPVLIYASAGDRLQHEAMSADPSRMPSHMANYCPKELQIRFPSAL